MIGRLLPVAYRANLRRPPGDGLDLLVTGDASPMYIGGVDLQGTGAMTTETGALRLVVAPRARPRRAERRAAMTIERGVAAGTA